VYDVSGVVEVGEDELPIEVVVVVDVLDGITDRSLQRRGVLLLDGLPVSRGLPHVPFMNAVA